MKVFLTVCLALALAMSGASLCLAAAPIKIGAFLSNTGPAAPLGTPEKETLEMLEEQINAAGGVLGRPIKVIIEDDASAPANAVRAAMKLINLDRVVAIIGGSTTGCTLAVTPITEPRGIPHISMAAGIDITHPVKRWVFRTPQTDVLAVQKVYEYLNSQGIDTIAVIYDSNAFGTSGRNRLVEMAPEAGIKIVAQEAFKTRDTDMTVQLTKIRGTAAQAVVCWGTNPGPAMVARNMKQLNMQIPLIQSHGIANRTFIELAGEAANGVVFPAGKLLVAESLPEDDPQREVLLQYARQFEAKYGKPADTFGGHAWDALMILVDAIERAGTTDAVQLRDAVESTTNFVGISGVFTYTPDDHDGLTTDAFVMVKIVDGEWTLVGD